MLYALGREHHAYAVTAALLAEPGTREAGAAMAREACHNWRAAPVQLLPLLILHSGRTVGPAMAKALRTASISRSAMQVHGSLAATVALTPYPRPRCPRQHARPTYSSTSAAALLAAKPVGVARLSDAPEVFGALLDAGPLTFRQAAQLYNLTFRWPGRMQALCAPLWLRHAGLSALPRLMGLITPYIGDYAVGEHYLTCLARMGRYALPALPAVAGVIERRTRIPVNDSTRDAETEIDERLLAAALETRHAILADCTATLLGG
ncbi:hypothetical protein [Kitasatospora sp. KL5]|uniref:hypothetical protein n=1 Tax=Kitasatospora sp. KL5 TaxID=3425125 RepID=UPI003D6E95B4